jgi:hypothetical protein
MEKYSHANCEAHVLRVLACIKVMSGPIKEPDLLSKNGRQFTLVPFPERLFRHSEEATEADGHPRQRRGSIRRARWRAGCIVPLIAPLLL